MQRLFDKVIEMILVFDIEGRILEGNRAARNQLLFYEGFTGINIRQIFHEDQEMLGERVFFVNDLGSEHVTRDDDDQSIGEYETIAFRKDGTCFPVFRRVFVLVEDGVKKGVSVCVDIGVEKEAIRQLVRAEEQSKEATKIRDRFVANITHELRTPINGILGHARNLHNAPLSKEQSFSLSLIEKSLKTMNGMIDNLLDYSKLIAGKFQLSKDMLSIRRLLNDIFYFHIHTIRQKGLRLLVRISKELPERIYADEVCISQILNNLLFNAIKFTPQGQISVDVSAKKENGRTKLEFAVGDTGIGISKEDIDKIFISFMQLDASVTRRYGGSGLGLCIVKQLVELMDGEIQVESVLGMGTTFYFYFYVDTEEGYGEKASENRIFPEDWFFYDGKNNDLVRDLVKQHSIHENSGSTEDSGHPVDSGNHGKLGSAKDIGYTADSGNHAELGSAKDSGHPVDSGNGITVDSPLSRYENEVWSETRVVSGQQTSKAEAFSSVRNNAWMAGPAISQKDMLAKRYQGLKEALLEENWERAEIILDLIKIMVVHTPEDYRQNFLKLEMEVRKENGIRAMELLELLCEKEV